jgi:uncharacterized protein YecT (DUF1311 family)
MAMTDTVRCAVLMVSFLIPLGDIHAQTQAAMNAQARADFARADAELNKTYQELLTKLRDAESKQKLKETERGWLTSRDSEAARAADQAGGGSMAATIRYETMTHLTRERIKELEAMLEGAARNKKDASRAKPLARRANSLGAGIEGRTNEICFGDTTAHCIFQPEFDFSRQEMGIFRWGYTKAC